MSQVYRTRKSALNDKYQRTSPNSPHPKNPQQYLRSPFLIIQSPRGREPTLSETLRLARLPSNPLDGRYTFLLETRYGQVQVLSD